jgi:hypothetical protein
MTTSPRRSRRDRLQRIAVAGICVAAVLFVAPVALAATGDPLLEGERNGTASQETELIGDIDANPTGTGGYVLRQSNIATGASAGGAAIYGCRTAGGTASGSAPCVRASNLAGGSAFEFASQGGLGGVITLGDPAQPNGGAPFTTNATGVATGLNADKVDGRDASDIAGAPGPATVLVEEASGALVPQCSQSLDACTDLAELALTEGSWLIQAKLVIVNDDSAPGAVSSIFEECGLVLGSTVVDKAGHHLGPPIAGFGGSSAVIALTAVEAGVAEGDIVGLRCTERVGDELRLEDIKMTALQVAVGP